jgi:NAD(P)-dependent dehydrogenase (short-subunit alcohol dehydrogenase family)
MTDLSLFPGADGKTALVTGAGGGIGRACVALFNALGLSVAALDRPGVELPGAYARHNVDATNDAALNAAVDRAAAGLGGFDVVVHAVGAVGEGSGTRKLHETAPAAWRQAIEVNLTSAFLVARAAFPHIRRPGGSLILFSSTNGRTGGTVLSGAAYGAAKAGIINLVRYLAREWAPEGIRVNALAPGPVKTPMLARLSAAERAALEAALPLGRFAEAAEIAAAVAFLASPHAVAMTGAVLNISSGLVTD